LEGEKSTSFPFSGSLRWSNRNYEGAEKNWKFWRGGGVNNFGIRRICGDRAFWNFRRQVGLKMFMPLW